MNPQGDIAQHFGSVKLKRMLNAQSVAVVGASESLAKAGGRIINSLLENNFPGAIYPVNPGRDTIQGLASHNSLADLDDGIDLVVLSTRADMVADQLRIVASKNVGGVVVFASGFSEVDATGAKLQAEISEIARSAGVPLIGPNCLGFMNGNHGLMGSSTVVMEGRKLPAGQFGFATQSGALGTYWLDMIMKASLGVSVWVSTGNEADVDLSDCVEFLVDDPQTEVIGLYIEGIRKGGKFRAAARRAFEVQKPILALKSGSSQQGAAAAASHTGALAGEDESYNALFRQYNIIRCESLTEIALQAEMLLKQPRRSGDRIAVISGSGGAGVLMTDACVNLGLKVPGFSPALLKALGDILPDFATPQNPVDLTAQIVQDPEMLGRIIEAIAASGEVDGISIFLGALNQVSDVIASSIIEKTPADLPCAVTWQAPPEKAVEFLKQSGFPVFAEIGPAIKAMAYQFSLANGWAGPKPEEAPSISSGGREAAEFDVEHQSKEYLCQRTSLMRPRYAYASPEADLSTHAGELSGPVVIKLQSPELLHKSGNGGIALGVETNRIPEVAAQLVREATGRGIWIDGVLVEEMVDFEHEFIVGLRSDPVFGPMLVIGRGGVAVELEPDVTQAFLPLSSQKIENMIWSLRAAPLFKGFRGGTCCDVPKLAMLIAELCDLYLQDEALAEIEVNPLVADKAGNFIALDALVARKGGV